jgi:hypothetical protein
MMKFLVLVFGLIVSVVSIENAEAQAWVQVEKTPSRDRVVEINTRSITKYQGLVFFELRDRAALKTEDSFTFYNQLFLVCNNGEVWDVASNLVFDSSGGFPEYEIKPGSEGPTMPPENLLAGRHTTVREACKRSNSKKPRELPITSGADYLYLLLAEETRIQGNLMMAWIKRYPIKREPILLPDGKPWIFQGKERMSSSISTAGEYSLLQWVMNCQNDTNTIAVIYEYDSAGKVKDSTVIPRERWGFTPTIPGSVGRTIQELICALR